MIAQIFDLDVIPGGVPTVVHVKQYQTDEAITFKLFSRNGSLTIPASYTDCEVRGTKSDGNGYSATATYINAGQSLYFLRNELKDLGIIRQTYGLLEVYQYGTADSGD